MLDKLINYINTRQYFPYGFFLYLVAILGTVSALADRSPGRSIFLSSILFLFATFLIIEQPAKARWFLLILPATCVLILMVMVIMGFNPVAGLLYITALVENGIAAFMLIAVVDALNWITRRVGKFATAHRPLDRQTSITN